MRAGQPFKGLRLPAQVCEVAKGELGGVAAILRLRLAQHQQSLGRIERQRSQEYRVDDREDGRVGPDAQRERHDRDEGESRIFQKHPGAVAKVLPESFHGLSSRFW